MVTKRQRNSLFRLSLTQPSRPAATRKTAMLPFPPMEPILVLWAKRPRTRTVYLQLHRVVQAIIRSSAVLSSARVHPGLTQGSLSARLLDLRADPLRIVTPCRPPLVFRLLVIPFSTRDRILHVPVTLSGSYILHWLFPWLFFAVVAESRSG